MHPYYSLKMPNQIRNYFKVLKLNILPLCLFLKKCFFKFWIKYFHFFTCRSPNPSHRPSAPPVSMRTEANDGLKCGETSYWDSDFKCFSVFSLCSNFYLKKSVLVTIIVSGRNTLTYINSFHQKGLMKKHVFAPKIEMVAKPDFVCSSSYQFLVFESLSESKAACSNISFNGKCIDFLMVAQILLLTTKVFLLSFILTGRPVVELQLQSFSSFLSATCLLPPGLLPPLKDLHWKSAKITILPMLSVAQGGVTGNPKAFSSFSFAISVSHAGKDKYWLVGYDQSSCWYDAMLN